jgi:thioredoxin-like negative regulator of GroEL
MQLDLSLLLRPSLYAPVPTTQIAAPFLDASHQPAPDTDLEILLSHRRFIHAADKATDILTSGSVSPSDTQKILDLLYTRFSCLVICNQTALAAKEAKPLSDLLARESSTYTRPYREIFLSQVPWSLRLLLLKLQGLGADVHRRTIMGLYALSTECRTLAAKAKAEKDDTSFATWKYRLHDLGLRVAGELIEMGELETARRHLDTLSSSDTDNHAEEVTKTRIRKTLLLLRLGDTQAAEKCLASSSSAQTDTDLDIQTQVLKALTSLCSSDFSTALSTLQSLAASHPHNPLVTHNLAIAHLYTNNVVVGSEMLEALITQDEVVFPTLLFNLCTMHELRTEKARDRKLDLVDVVAGLGDQRVETRVGGFEKGMAEFKLT